ncbi:MAG TPA: hypothetical protein VJV74_03485 [Terriglobia bacterium]|nr:hypothetical protein [Terriglobia bacterium]
MKEATHKEPIIRAAYRISEEIGREVEELVRGDRRVSPEELDALYRRLGQYLDPEAARRVQKALANALVPPDPKAAAES